MAQNKARCARVPAAQPPERHFLERRGPASGGTAEAGHGLWSQDGFDSTKGGRGDE